MKGIFTRNMQMLFFAFLMIAVTACSKKIVFPNSAVVPAAEGYAKVKKDNNNNYQVEVDVKHLADPKNLTPARSNYVVWIETESNGIKNLGQINSSSGLLSSTKKASLKAITPYEPRRIMITAEDDASLQYPGSQVIMKTDEFRIR